MGTSLSNAARRVEVKPLDLPLIGATPNRQETVKPLDGDWLLPLIGKALDAVMQRKEAALTMGLDAGQMTRQLTGDGHLSARRLGMLGEDFWRALVDQLSEYYGWDDEAAQLERALEVQRAASAQIERLTRKMVAR